MIGEDYSQGSDLISKNDAYFFGQRNCKILYLQFLTILENLKKDHEINFAKLKAIFPNDLDVLDMSDFFGEQKFQYVRKKILDAGNEAIRNLEKDINSI